MLLGWSSDSGVDTLPNMGVTWNSSEIGWEQKKEKAREEKGREGMHMCFSSLVRSRRHYLY